MSAVSPIILGPISSVKSSKSINPPTVERMAKHYLFIYLLLLFILKNKWSETKSLTFTFNFILFNSMCTEYFIAIMCWYLTSHLDLLHYLQQLHLCGHVSHGPHAFSHILVVQISILIVVKLFEGLLQLCKEGQGSHRHDSSLSGLNGWASCSQIYRFKNQKSNFSRKESRLSMMIYDMSMLLIVSVCNWITIKCNRKFSSEIMMEGLDVGCGVRVRVNVTVTLTIQLSLS